MIEQAGTHLIADFWDVKIINSEKAIKEILVIASKKAKSVLLNLGIHKFKPQGITGFALLAESHISLHTWPESNYVAIDVFTCGKSTPLPALEFLKEKFEPKKIQIQEIKRGNFELYRKQNFESRDQQRIQSNFRLDF